MRKTPISDKNEDEEEDDFAAKDSPTHFLIRFLHQSSHVVVDFDHFFIGAFNVVSHSIELLVLVVCFSLEILRLSLNHVGSCQNLINLVVLLINVLLLLFEDLPVV